MSELLKPGQSRVLEAFEARKALRDTVTQDLEDLGRAFQEEFVTKKDASPKDWKDFLEEDLKLRLKRTRNLIPNLNPTMPEMTLSYDQLQEYQALFGESPIGIALDIPSGIPLEALGLMYPKMAGHWTLDPKNRMNKARTDGYFIFEDVANAPHTRTIVKDLIDTGGLEDKTGLRLMHPVQYHLANYNHHMRTREYFDLRTWSRIRDPRSDVGVLGARVRESGHPYIYQCWDPGYRRDDIGARLAGVIQ